LTLLVDHEWAMKIGALAEALLEAAAARDERAGEVAAVFAEAVLGAMEPASRLAAAVVSGGPLAVRRAVELVRMIGDRLPAHARADKTGTAKL
jgi:hypothetical protein